MQVDEAVELIRPAVPADGQRWADLGAGTGVFTLALAELLGPAARIVAVDRDPHSLGLLRRALRRTPREAEVATVEGDFQALDSIAELADAPLDGALFANALHFAPQAGRVLAQAAARLGRQGRVVVVEYDGRPPSRWVPYPLPVRRLSSLAPGAGLRAPRVVGERPSAYGGVMYSAVLEREE